jgi:hypothetical protein
MPQRAEAMPTRTGCHRIPLGITPQQTSACRSPILTSKGEIARDAHRLADLDVGDGATPGYKQADSRSCLRRDPASDICLRHNARTVLLTSP